MRRLAGIATVCGAAIWGSGSLTDNAAAERPLGRAMAHAARGLAAIIRDDARRIARSHATGAVISKRCCGTRVLDVYYRAAPWSYLPWFGAYELKLETRRAFLRSVSISYFPTEASWSYGSPSKGEGPTYSFTITPPNRGEGWRFSALDSFFGCGATLPARGGTCEGLSQAIGFDERQGSASRFDALFEQAVVVTQKARRHAPISGENLFSPGARSAR